MIRFVDIKQLVMLDERASLRSPCRLKIFSFEMHDNKPRALVLSEDIHNILVIKDLDSLTPPELKYFQNYLKKLTVCQIPCGPYDTSMDIQLARQVYGVDVKTI